MYFDPDAEPATRAQVRQAFVRSLCDLPLWAVHRAFDAWERTGTRRPSPGEIRILAQNEIRPITDELRRREALEREAEEERRRYQAARPSAEQAAAILAAAGFTPARFAAVSARPMARSLAEAERSIARAADGPSHWSEAADPDPLKRITAMQTTTFAVQYTMAAVTTPVTLLFPVPRDLEAQS